MKVAIFSTKSYDRQFFTAANFHLESEPAQITDETLAELCEWLWVEFESTPLNLEFSWYERLYSY